jgi:CRISPR-associated protein Csm2
MPYTQRDILYRRNRGMDSFQRGNRTSYQGSREPPQIPPAVSIGGFYAEGKNVKTDLFDKTAEAVANSFVGKNQGRSFGVSKTQLRRLFDEVKRFEQNLDGTEDAWKKQFPYIRMIRSKVSYNLARAKEKSKADEAKVYDNLAAFITECIGLIKDEMDYHVFVALFEAAYGFYYEKNPKKD